MNIKTIKNLFVIAALYDFILGVLFLVAFEQIYTHFNITLPNHDAYVQFAALLVTIFGIGFWFVARDPVRNKDIIKMGILLKIAYSGTVFYHSVMGSLPFVFLLFGWFDLVFLILFVIALQKLKTII